MYLSYFGIRVTDLDRSLDFYTKFFGLREVRRGDGSERGGGTYVLLRDDRSGAKLEVNWYPKGSPYASPYVPGEGLDHIAFRVDNVDRFLKELRAQGVEAVPTDPILAEPPGYDFKVAYVKDPDGNWIELYHQPGSADRPSPDDY